MIVFVDESGVYLVPGVVKTWAPCGQTPRLPHHLTNDHLSCISAVTLTGALYFQVQRTAYDSAAVIDFLDALHTVLPGNLLVIWDSAPIHRSQAIKDYLAQGAQTWLRLERLPGYAPELNPDEGVWNAIKYGSLKNVCSPTLTHLEGLVTGVLQELSAVPDRIRAMVRQARLL